MTVVSMARQVGPVDGQVGPLVNAQRAEPDDLIPVDGIVGAPMRQAHVAETDKQNATLPWTIFSPEPVAPIMRQTQTR